MECKNTQCLNTSSTYYLLVAIVYVLVPIKCAKAWSVYVCRAPAYSYTFSRSSQLSYLHVNTFPAANYIRKLALTRHISSCTVIALFNMHCATIEFILAS